MAELSRDRDLSSRPVRHETASRVPHKLSNYLKTTVLLAGLTALVLAVGERLGGVRGMMFAGVFVVIMNFVSYWFSDRIALAIHGARPLERGEAPELYEIIERLCARADLPTPKLYIIDMPTPNAFATGRSPEHAAVAVTTGILELMDRRELEGVLAHELSHVRNRDTLIGTVAATLAGLITQAARMLFWFGGALISSRDDRGESGLVQLGLLIVAPIAATMLQLAVSRSREYEADASGSDLTGDPDALADALLKLDQGVKHYPYNYAPAMSHLFIVNPLSGGGVLSLFSTHPPIEERVRRLREMSGRN